VLELLIPLLVAFGFGLVLGGLLVWPWFDVVVRRRHEVAIEQLRAEVEARHRRRQKKLESELGHAARESHRLAARASSLDRVRDRDKKPEAAAILREAVEQDLRASLDAVREELAGERGLREALRKELDTARDLASRHERDADQAEELWQQAEARAEVLEKEKDDLQAAANKWYAERNRLANENAHLKGPGDGADCPVENARSYERRLVEAIGHLLPNVELVMDSSSVLARKVPELGRVLDLLRRLDRGERVPPKDFVERAPGWAEVRFATGGEEPGRLYYFLDSPPGRRPVLVSVKKDQDLDVAQLLRYASR
jgi:hypothetical protein